MAQTNGEPAYEEGDEFIDFTAEEVGTWVVERVEWEQRWKQGDGAWAYYLRAKTGEKTRHKLESGLEWDIQHGKLDEAPEGDPSNQDRDLESDGGITGPHDEIIEFDRDEHSDDKRFGVLSYGIIPNENTD